MRLTVIDVGGTYIKYACMTEEAEIISRGKVPTPMSGRDEFISTIVDIHKSMPESTGIAISLPGIIDADKGYCFTSGALKYNDDFYICDAIYEKCPVNISIENDAKCAAFAEVSLGSLKDVDDGFVMVFGTGIGGTFIKNRQIHRGHHFASGEISFIITNEHGNIVESDIFGSQCGALGLCKLYAAKKNIPIESVDGIMFFDAVKNGDSTAIDCLNQITRAIAVQISNIQMILDPQRIAIGGGISVQPMFIEYIRRHLADIYANSEFSLPHAEVVTCEFYNDANLIGALQCHLEKFKNNKTST